MADTPTIHPLLFLSTGHLTWETCQKIEAAPTGWGKWSLANVEYGFFGYVMDERPDDMPDDLWACFEYAHKLRISYLRFDCDESLIDALPDHSATHP